MSLQDCHKLVDNYSVSDFIKNIDHVPRINKSLEFGVMAYDPKFLLHEKVYHKLSQLGPLTSLIFEMRTNADKGSIHIDIDEKTRRPHWSSLNIIIHGQGVMKWFNPAAKGKLSYNPNGKVYYQYWDSNYGQVLDEWRIGKIALVRTDIAHQAWNYDKDIRLVVSIRWGNRTSWEETKDFFSKFTID